MTNDLIYLKLKDSSFSSYYENDVKRIQRAAASQGYSISAQDAYEAWSRHSESFAAGWLILEGEDNSSIWSSISNYFDR